MDNAPWHKKAKRLIKENADGQYNDINYKIVFVYLPPYSPNLNLIEQVWRMTRREAKHNKFFNSAEDLEQTIDDYYSLYNQPNDWLKSLCSFHFTN